jgi:cytochrome bd-type quinol oxidase subunit 2
MPSFPLGHTFNKLITITFIIISQMEFEFVFKHVFLPIFYAVIICANLRTKSSSTEHEQASKLSRNCFVTLFLFFVAAFALCSMAEPSTKKEGERASITYTFSVYGINIL